jgi:hypothetical protein
MKLAIIEGAAEFVSRAVTRSLVLATQRIVVIAKRLAPRRLLRLGARPSEVHRPRHHRRPFFDMP